jgi:hypothetical protein
MCDPLECAPLDETETIVESLRQRIQQMREKVDRLINEEVT